jgi:hypothetical protein
MSVGVTLDPKACQGKSLNVRENLQEIARIGRGIATLIALITCTPAKPYLGWEYRTCPAWRALSHGLVLCGKMENICIGVGTIPGVASSTGLSGFRGILQSALARTYRPLYERALDRGWKIAIHSDDLPHAGNIPRSSEGEHPVYWSLPSCHPR